MSPSRSQTLTASFSVLVKDEEPELANSSAPQAGALAPVEPVDVLVAAGVPDVLPTVDAIEDSLSRVVGKLGRMTAEIRKLDSHFRSRLRQSEEALVEVEERYLTATQTALATAPQAPAATEAPRLDHIRLEIERVEARIPEITKEVAEMLDDPSIELGRIARKNIEQGELKAYLKALQFAIGLSDSVQAPAAEPFVNEALPYSRKQAIAFCTAEVDILMHILEKKGQRAVSGQIVAQNAEPLKHPVAVHLIQQGQRVETLNTNNLGEFRFDRIPEGRVRVEFVDTDNRILAQLEIESDRRFDS